jgi:hypothetical protein
MQHPVPQKLVDLAIHASRARCGFNVLGGNLAADALEFAVEGRLRNCGWNIGMNGNEAARSLSYFFNMLHTFEYNQYRSPKFVRHNIEQWLNEISTPEERAFILATDHDVLRAVYDGAIADIAKLAGDPFAVKFNQRSLVRSAFDNVRDGFGGTPSAEGTLHRNLREVIDIMRPLRRQGIAGGEFLKRMVAMLQEKYEWPPSDADKWPHTPETQLWHLVSITEKTGNSTALRYELQDDTKPPRQPLRAAKDFILAHAGDLVPAAKAAAQDLTRERAAQPAPPRAP